MNEHRTAITRRGSSAPMKWLDTKGLLIGTLLDYGCGKGVDADIYDMDRYDPHYQPNMPNGKYVTVTCNYVLNVIQSKTRRAVVMQSIRNKLTPEGIAYITVRNDITRTGTTRIGTWQGKIILDLPVVRKCSGYIIYKLNKGPMLRFSSQV